ncbi:MAG: hypothetical protein MUP16_03845 [Sedimentisphaerales bacterium]|nr:hypothetical protein [Sedimentisphaerales bacterium]
MTEQEQQAPDNNVRGQTPDFAKATPGQSSGAITPEVLKSAMKAFKKRLKLTALDEDSHLGRGPFSGGPMGVFAIQPPSQFPREVWEELCRQGRLRNSGHGMYELAK